MDRGRSPGQLQERLLHGIFRRAAIVKHAVSEREEIGREEPVDGRERFFGAISNSVYQLIVDVNEAHRMCRLADDGSDVGSNG